MDALVPQRPGMHSGKLIDFRNYLVGERNFTAREERSAGPRNGQSVRKLAAPALSPSRPPISATSRGWPGGGEGQTQKMRGRAFSNRHLAKPVAFPPDPVGSCGGVPSRTLTPRHISNSWNLRRRRCRVVRIPGEPGAPHSGGFSLSGHAFVAAPRDRRLAHARFGKTTTKPHAGLICQC